MDLATYLIEKDGKLDRSGRECKRLAKASGTTPYYLYMLALRHKTASPELAMRIANKSTDGNVTRAALRPDLWGDAKPAQAA